MRRRPFYQQTQWRLIAALVVIAVVLTVWHRRADAAGRLSLPDRAARALLMPVQYSFTVVWDETSGAASGLLHSRQLTEENRRLKEQCARLEATLVQRQIESLDYRDMRAQLGLRFEDRPEGVRARVVGWSGRQSVRRTIDIVAGAGREIRKNDIVRTYTGLVGRVESADGSWAEVATLLDPETGVAVVVKPSNATGAIHGPDPGSLDPDLLRLVHLDPKAYIAQGDKVFTSAIGQMYPPGIQIGQVEEVLGRPGPGQPKTALVRPYVDFENLNYVIVVRPE